VSADPPSARAARRGGLATVEAERNGLVGVRSTDRSAPRAAEAVESGGVPEAVTIPVAPEIGPAVAPEEAAPGAASEMAPADAASETAPAEPAALLMRLKGIGPEFAAVLWLEALFRGFGNRRQIAAHAGLAPVAWQSGGIDRDQGIAKAGNPRREHKILWGAQAATAGVWVSFAAMAGYHLRNVSRRVPSRV
jgi:Transposase IS116/IS110/IS902 family